MAFNGQLRENFCPFLTDVPYTLSPDLDADAVEVFFMNFAKLFQPFWY